MRREFALDEESLEDLKAELIDAQRVATDEEGKVLVWIGEQPVASSLAVQESVEKKKKRKRVRTYSTPAPDS